MFANFNAASFTAILQNKEKHGLEEPDLYSSVKVTK